MLRIGQQDEVGVGVHVDEAWADDAATDINHAAGLNIGLAGADDRHGVAGNADTAAKPGLAGAVDYSSIAQKQVEHASPLPQPRVLP